MKLDDADHRLMKALQTNNRLTAEQLAEICNLSASAAAKRVKRLRKNGVIARDISLISAAAIGPHLELLALVSVERESRTIIDTLKRAIRASDRVINAYYVTGNHDFILHIIAKDMEDYETFTREFFYDLQHVDRVNTMVVIDTIKSHGGYPLNL